MKMAKITENRLVKLSCQLIMSNLSNIVQNVIQIKTAAPFNFIFLEISCQLKKEVTGALLLMAAAVAR